MRGLWHELRLAARALLKRPGFSGVAVVTLALGIGATVAIFTVVNAVLLEPLPYPDSRRIVVLNHHAPGLDLPELNNSTGTLVLYREHARSFEAVSAAEVEERNLTGGDRPARVQVVAGYPSLFRVLGVRPALGRAFGPDDAREGAAPVAVLTHRGWVNRFGEDPAILGKTARFDGEVTEIVGVMPAGFAFPDPETVALLPATLPATPDFGTFGMRGVARLAPGVSLEEARREVAALQSRIPEMSGGQMQQAFLDRARWSADAIPLRDVMVEDVETALWVVLGTVGFLLLIACANVANLFLVRAEERQHEVAIRAALGASRGRLTASFLGESLLLGLAGGVAGLLLAAAGVDLLLAREGVRLPRLHEVAVDGDVLLFALAVSVAAGLLFGSVAMIRYLGRSFGRTLREGPRGGTGDRSRQRTRKGLITAQVALALVLLVGAGLMLRSYGELRDIDPGVRTGGVVTLGLSLGNDVGLAQADRIVREIRREVEAVPGVGVVGATNALPLDPRGINGSDFDVESRPRPEDELPTVAYYAVVTPGFFQALGIPVLRGRPMAEADALEPRRVVWVSRDFAEAHLGDEPLEERLRFGSDSTWLEVAGVVGNVRTFGIGEERRPMAYFPIPTTVTGVGTSMMRLTVRSEDGRTAALVPSIREAIRRVRPEIPVTSAETMDEVLSSSMAETSMTMILLAIAAGMALVLGAVGIYGVISYVVSRRTREIGVRIALGAGPGEVRSLVVRQSAAVTVVGILLGLAGAFALTRVMGALLYGVSPTDPVTFVGVTALLGAVSVGASWLPARRAVAVSPVEALREE